MSANFRNEYDMRFYADCAISAMQGIQESGMKIEGFAAMLMPAKMSKVAFDMADAMLAEYQKRTDETYNNNNNKAQ